MTDNSIEDPQSAWRPMHRSDLDAVVRLADAVFPDHRESAEIFAEKLRLHPQGCFVLGAAGEGAALGGYLFSHPYRLGQIPALNGKIGVLPDECDCLYIHDLTLVPGKRGSGIASAMVGHLEQQAHHSGFGALALTSLVGSRPFWARLGFASADVAARATKLAAYGEGADYMTKPVRGRDG